MPPDPVKALLKLVRAAARDGTAEALLTHDPAPSKSAPPLLDKRARAHALGVSTATVDRLCRDERIPYVVGPHVGPSSLRIGNGHRNRQAP
jgi:hypothetical protein